MGKREADSTDRTYTVHTCEHGAYVLGLYAPTDDVSALLKNWSYRGLNVLALGVAKRLGALVAVTDGGGSAGVWLEAIEAEGTDQMPAPSTKVESGVAV